MTERDNTLYVRHMLDAARQAMEFSNGISRGDLQPFGLETLALTRLLEIIGEAARRTSTTFREQHPQIEWKLIAGMRDRLIHGYDRVDLDVLWDTCKQDLPILAENLEALLAKEDRR